MAGTWQRLAHVELSSTTATISTGTFTAKENLRFVFYGIGNSSNQVPAMTFNNDTGSNYARRQEDNGNSDETQTSHASIKFNDKANTGIYIVGDITNKADKEKLIISEFMSGNTAGVGNAPNRMQVVGKWANTSDQITRIDIELGTSDWASGSYITVLGASDDIVTDEKTTLTNVPENTQYRETDTRKIYRAKSVGFASGTSGSGSDWTEVAFDSSTATNGASASGNVVTRTGSASWNAYIRSTTHYLDPSEGGGEVYFTVSNNTHGSVGLEKTPFNSHPTGTYQNADYSFHTTTATNNMYESTTSYDGTDWNNATNEWRITMDSAGLVKYYYRVNSSGSWNLERTSTVTASGKYYVTASPNSSASCTCYIKSDAAIAWKERGTA